MNAINSIDKEQDSSAIPIDLVVTSDWINKFLKEHEITIPVSDQYSVTNLSVELEDGKISLTGDVKEKNNSSLLLDCTPIWNSYEQRFFVENFNLKTDTNNILLKSAGWIANTFMGSKLDKKLEEALNHIFNQKRSELIANGLFIPLPDGKGSASIDSVTVEDMKFESVGIAVKAIVVGRLNLKLGRDDMIIS